MSTIKMSWNDRFALIDHFKPTDPQILAVFGLTQDELETARQLKQAGTFRPTSNMDLAQYDGVFANAQVSMAPAPMKSATPSAAITKPSITSASPAAKPMIKQRTATAYAKPESATKQVKEPQKRGRKGDRIATALAAVPTTQVSAEEFSKQYNVSIAVLRQARRFLAAMTPEQQAVIGNVCVRQDKETKTLMIWRELPQVA